MCITRRSIVTFVIGAVAAPLFRSLAVAQSALPARSNSAGAVRVVVTPKNIASGASWDFDVTMDTHVKPLADDLTKTAVLIDGAGRRYQPASWQGDPPGGHHRKGVLRFPAPTGQTTSFEIQIQGLGGVKTRVFQWTMK